MKSKNLLIAGALALSTVMTPVASMFSAMPICAVQKTEATTHTLTISANENETLPVGAVYQAYQVFKGLNSANTDVSNLTNVEFGDNFNKSAATDFYAEFKSTFEIENKVNSLEDVLDYLTKNSTDTTAVALAKILVDGNNGAGYLTGDPKESSAVVKDQKTVTIKDLTDGYYLVKNKEGTTETPTKYILEVVEDTTAYNKNTEMPKAEKKVHENLKTTNNPELVTKTENGSTKFTDKNNDVADYNIGDEVPFTLSAVLPDMDDYDDYTIKFNDLADEGLTINTNTIKVYRISVGEDGNTNEVDITKNARVSINEVPTKDESGNKLSDFDVTVKAKDKNDKERNFANGDKIEVRFTATINKDAKVTEIVGGEIKEGKNENKFTLEFSNNPSNSESFGKTPEDKVVVLTYKLGVQKLGTETTEDNKNVKLTGAKFKLKNNKTGQWIVATETATGEYRVTGTTKYETAEEIKNDESLSDEQKAEAVVATEFAVDDEGLLTIKGLDSDTYILKETQAPDGYNLPSNPNFEVVLTVTTSNGQNYAGENVATQYQSSVTGTSQNYTGNNDVVNVYNTKGPNLPETGGMGTTALYTIGATLVGGAAIFFVTNKRMKNED